MAIRIHDLAKELGINSKAIIEKCIAEDVPAEVVKNHMSVIPIGLAASIREWFAAGVTAAASAGSAVESASHPDVEKLRTKPGSRARKAKPKSEGDDSNGDGADHASGTAVAEPPADTTIPAAPIEVPVTPSRAAPSPRPAAAPSAPVVPPTSTPAAPAGAPPRPTPVHTPAPIAPAARTVPAPGAQPVAPSGPSTATPPSGPQMATAIPHTHPAPPAPPGGAGPAGPGGPGTPSAPVHSPVGTITPGGSARPVIGGPRVIRAAPMNIPTRPTVVKPAGEQLTQRTAVKLSGPKVVRVEAPEPVDNRPRRPSVGGPGGPSGPRGGRGVIGGGDSGPAGDRDSRRNKRRTAGPAETAAKRRPGAPEDVPVGTGFSEADLIEREERLARAGGLLRQRRREARAREQASGERALRPSQTGEKVVISAPFTIKDLASASGIKSSEIIKKLFMKGIMATANSGMDPERAMEIMYEFHLDLDIVTAKTAEETVASEFVDRKRQDERPRPPVVTIMGHVDHGKTSLLDAIRRTNVAAGEAGGITQKTSAFRVPVEIEGETKAVVFLDTPGHEAFTEMRSRGATLTDIVVLVVGAPEGVMPQTIESINHAKAAKVPIVVAINKVDSPQATANQLQKVMGQLAEQGLNPIEWGGTTEVVKTSATKGTGIQELLEILDLQAQTMELKADFSGSAKGRVIEATLTDGRGPTAVVLVQEGELAVGDFVVAGPAFGRVRDITDDQGRKLKVAGPATPVQISGLDQVPAAGDPLFTTDSLRKAEEAANQRRDRDRLANLHQPKVTLDSLFSQMKDANVKEILIVLKADVQGSVDVLKNQIEKLSSAEVKIRVLHAAVGGISESDVLLADASKAVIVGFNVIPTGKARSLADQKSVEVRMYQVIYDIVDDVKKAASGMLEPEIRQDILGHAEVRQVFKVTKVGTIAGCYVTDGLVQRDALIRVTRNGVVVENDRILEQLKRFKDDAKDVKAGMECGMKIVGYDDIKQGDILECYKKVEVKRTL